MVNHNKSIPSVTTTLGLNAKIEAFSANTKIGLKTGLTYNNYKGVGYSLGTSLSLSKGLVSLGFNIKDGKHAFSLRVDPWKLLKMSENQKDKIDEELHNQWLNLDPNDPNIWISGPN